MSKQDKVTPLFAKVAEGLWVGNATSAEDVQFLADADITAIINLTGKMDRMVEDVDYFDYALPSSELLETEFQKTITKLEAIMSDLSELRNNNRNVLIHCLDGKNKSMLAAGYYLITRCGKKADATIDLLEQIYFSPEQRKDEQESRMQRIELPDDITEGVATRVDVDEQQRRYERNAIRGLTLSSFKKILRLKGRK